MSTKTKKENHYTPDSDVNDGTPTISLDVCAFTTLEELDLEIQRQINAMSSSTMLDFAYDLPPSTRLLIWIWLTDPDMRALPEVKIPLFVRYMSEAKKAILRKALSQWVAVSLVGELATGKKLDLDSISFCG